MYFVVKRKIFEIFKKNIWVSLMILSLAGASIFLPHIFASPVQAENPNLIENGDFESWFDGDPDGWSYFDPPGEDGDIDQEIAVVHSGSSSLSIASGITDTSALFQGETGLTPGTSYVLSVWGYTPSTNTQQEASFLVLNGEYTVNATQLFNWDTESWENIVDDDVDAGLNSINDLTDTWEEFNSDTLGVDLIVPASGKIYIYLLTVSRVEYAAGEIIYFDDVSLSLAEEGVPFDGNLPAANVDSKTKLIWVNDIYYYAFSSSTNGIYDVYLTTSTSGVNGTWSEPQVIFEGIKPTESDGGSDINGLFAFEYNNFGNYFGLAVFASSTFDGFQGEIQFTSSTNGTNWSNTTTVNNVSDGNYNREIYLDFSEDEEFAAVVYMSNSNDAMVSYSADKGGAWDDTSFLNWGNGYPLLAGLGISGSGVSRVLHVGMVSREDLGISYASSTDNVGTSWSTSTVTSDIFDYIPSFDTSYAFNNLVKFSVNGNGLPGFIYYIPLENSGTGPIDTTSTVFYAYGDGSGGWSTSSIMNVGIQLTSHADHYTSDLFYFNDNIITFFWGANGSPTAFVNTSSEWSEIFNGTGQTLAYFSGLSSAFDETGGVWAGSYVTSDGQLNFVTSSLSLSVSESAPAAPSGLVVSDVSSSTVTLTWSDNSNNEDGFVFFGSGDGADYVQTGLSSTNSTSTVLELPAPNTHLWVKVAAYNSVGTSTFSNAVDFYSLPDTSSVLVFGAIGTSTIEFSVNSGNNPTSTDYVIHESVLDLCLLEDNTLGICDLAAINMVYEWATTTIQGLDANTEYSLQAVAIYAGDPGDDSKHALGAISVVQTEAVSLFPSSPSNPNNVVSTSSINFSWTDNSDDESGFIIEKSTDGENFSVFATTTADVTSTIVVDLIPNTSYVLRVAAFNDSGTSTYATSATDYTNPVVPVDLQVNSVSSSSVSLVWNNNLNGSGTVYYLNYNSGFVTTTATSTNISGLTSNTEYVFSVRAQYLSSSTLYTSYSDSVSTTTLVVEEDEEDTPVAPVSSGGASIVVPTMPNLGLIPVFIPQTVFGFYNGENTELKLSFSVNNARYYAISENDNFTGSSWIDYVPNIKYVLRNNTPGQKIIYIKFRSFDGGESAVQKINITVDSKEVEETNNNTPPSYTFTTLLSYGMRGEAVKQLQLRLQDLGYMSKDILANGIFGPATRAAVIKLQLQNNLQPPAGFVGPGTRAVLNTGTNKKEVVVSESVPHSYTFTTLLSYGMRGEAVKQLQLRLQDLGYMSKDILANGIFGPATRAAVIKLQLQNNLQPPAGFVGPGTRAVLNK